MRNDIISFFYRLISTKIAISLIRYYFREWREGLLSNVVVSAGDSVTWIILNGDVEPDWAEALNSALDDNRLLTLPNGVGLKLGSGTK